MYINIQFFILCITSKLLKLSLGPITFVYVFGAEAVYISYFSLRPKGWTKSASACCVFMRECWAGMG